mmetsp:Transcript_9194/g.18004  ORF Transcript_9194/g.18004 Transcript_9194/m.18004 type:complete len:84 (-) Transcript_9194:232-483(-)
MRISRSQINMQSWSSFEEMKQLSGKIEREAQEKKRVRSSDGLLMYFYRLLFCVFSRNCLSSFLSECSLTFSGLSVPPSSVPPI